MSDDEKKFEGTGEVVAIIQRILAAAKDYPHNEMIQELRKSVQPMLTPEMCELMLVQNASLMEQQTSAQLSPMQLMLAQSKAVKR